LIVANRRSERAVSDLAAEIKSSSDIEPHFAISVQTHIAANDGLTADLIIRAFEAAVIADATLTSQALNPRVK
jgi:hypothetical protein